MKSLKIKKTALLFSALFIGLTACEKDNPEPNDPNSPNPSTGNEPAIELDCNYFNQDRVLVDNPEAPVDYIISCEINVDAKLTVEPGVVIAFESDASMKVNQDATLIMEGTANKPIVLTGVAEEKGLWRGMLIESNKASNTMKYVTIEYAGSSSASHSGGMVPAGLQVDKGGDVSIDHCTFRHCKDYGLFWSSDKYISITNSIFTKNDVPIITEGWNQIKLYNNTNSYTGNVNDYVHLKHPGISNDNQEITMRKIDVPYYITTGGYNRYDVDHAKLVIEPGVDIIVATSGTKMRIRDDASIQATGTASDPITFRGVNGVKADWGYIIIQSGSALNEIEHTNIQNAGNSMANIKAAVQVDYGSYLNIHDVNFTDNAGYAVGMLYSGGMAWPVLDYANLATDNNKLFCKGANGDELSDPNDPNS